MRWRLFWLRVMRGKKDKSKKKRLKGRKKEKKQGPAEPGINSICLTTGSFILGIGEKRYAKEIIQTRKGFTWCTKKKGRNPKLSGKKKIMGGEGKGKKPRSTGMRGGGPSSKPQRGETNL